jgi:uncharacterized protein (TIGR02598 family)
LAFSLLEVVVAVGIFAIGIVAILALFAPAAKSVSANAEAEAAAAVAQSLAADLQRRVAPADPDPFAAVTALLKKSTAAGGHELTADNTYRLGRTGRTCRTCQIARSAARRAGRPTRFRGAA